MGKSEISVIFGLAEYTHTYYIIAGQLFSSDANAYKCLLRQLCNLYIYTSSIQLGAHVQMTALTGACFERGPPRLYLSAIAGIAPIQPGHSGLV